MALVGSVVFLSLAASACDDEDGLFDEDGGVRFVHARPGAGPVDVYLAGESEPRAEGLAYGQATGFERLDTGLYEFEVREADAPADADPLATTEPIDVFDEEEYSTVIAGGDEGVETVVVAHDFERDDTAVHLVHASPDAPALGVDVADDETLEIETVEPLSAAPGGALSVPDDRFQLGIVADGDRLTAFTLPDLDDDEETLAVAIGNVADSPRAQTGFNLLLLTEGGSLNVIRQNPRVFVNHAITDGPAVDVFLEDGEDDDRNFVVTDLEFGGLSEGLQVPPGNWNADVTIAGSQQVLFDQDTSGLNGGERYLLVVAGSAEEDDFELMTLADDFDTESDEPNVRVAHASPDTTTVDVALVEDGSLSDPVLAEDLEFAEEDFDDLASPVPAGEQTIGLAESGDAVPIASFDINVPDGADLFAVVAGSVNPVEGEQPLQLFLIDATMLPWMITDVPAAE